MGSLFYPFRWLSELIVVHILGMDAHSPLGKSLIFFLYDVPKLLILLGAVSLLVSFCRTYLPPEEVRRFLEKQPLLIGNILASIFGAITPFCSCSAVPFFIGFLSAGIPLGITFSYLIAAPMVDAVAIFLLWSLLGLQTAVFYTLFGVILAVVVGYVISNLKLEKWVEDFAFQMALATESGEATPKLTPRQRWQMAHYQTVDLVKSVWLYVVIGIAIGAFIHGYVPQDLVLQWAGKENPLAVIVATMMGVPVYTNITGVLPVAEALLQKQMPLGTVLAFTMAVTALSLPQMIMLRRVLKLPLLLIFVGITTSGIISIGYLFNLLLAPN